MDKNNELRMTIRFKKDNPEQRRIYDGLIRRRSATKQPISTMVMEALDMYLRSPDMIHVGWEEVVRDIVHSELEKAKQSWPASTVQAFGSYEKPSGEDVTADAIETNPEDLDSLISGLGF